MATTNTKTAELFAEIVALKARVTKLEAMVAAPRPRGPWQPSSQLQAAKQEYLRRKAAGERVVIRAGKCVLTNEPEPETAS